MFIIDYNNVKNKFVLTFKEFMEHDIFTEENDYLVSKFLRFNPALQGYVINENQIEEILLWFERDKKEYEVTDYFLNKISQLEKLYSKETSFHRNRIFDESLFKIPLLPKQLEIVNWCLKRDNYLNACDTGIGKSPITIACMSQMFKDGYIDKFLIITPIGLGIHWKHEILKFSNVFSEDDFYFIDNDNKEKPYENTKDKKIIIVPNNIFFKTLISYRKDYTSKLTGKSVKWTKCFCDFDKIFKDENLCCIIDEAHCIKHSSSIRTKAISTIKPYFKFRWLLTATPNINKFEHIYSLLNFVDRSIIGTSENAFKLLIATSIGNKLDKYAINYYSAKKVAEYREKFKPYITQVLKTDIEEFKIKKFIHEVYCELHPLQKQLYQKVCEKEINILQEEFDKVTYKQLINKLPLIMKVIDCPSVITQNIYDSVEINGLLKRWKLKHDNKFQVLKTLLEEKIDEQGLKVIVFDSSPDILNLLYQEFSKYNPLIIHGSLKDEKDKHTERQAKVDKFNNSEENRLFLLSSHTSNSGLNLQHKCSDIIIYSSPFDSTEFRQLQDRVYRITSTKDVNVYCIYYPNTVDNIRMQRNFNRVELNDKLDKEITQSDLNKLLNGSI